ncbi:4-phosphopantetheine adenylyltransferase isoform 1 [Hibiscus syriacus]|uniref:4-phosphopantetheine adenylyltransferase isoform 1 n=1 Tax=Hibiscus syriacus TaxID=106335 RepID=A0A6A3A6G9_HIBSY|nr:4-phosphopantetheine adenylyltransferase isoform 1 [Hibiscus syriacus]
MFEGNEAWSDTFTSTMSKPGIEPTNIPLKIPIDSLDVNELLWFDLDVRLERRISELRNELAEWVLEKEEDGRQSCFIFHAFSNTSLLIFLGRVGLREKIKEVIIDSGAADPFNPKVWAAGITVAKLKKQSYLVNGLGSAVTDSKLQKEEPGMIEAVVISTLEKFFASILNMPDVNRFVFNIYKDEGRPENKQTIYQIPLLVPKMKKDWFSAEEVERFCERLDSPACDFH